MGLRISDGVARKNFSFEDVTPTANLLKVAKATFDATDGVDVGDVSLGVTIPSGAVVVHSLIKISTTFTSAGTETTDKATIAVTLASAGDIASATAIEAEGDAWDAKLKNGTPVIGTATSAISLSADKTPKVTVGVEALTAGKMDIYLFYV